MIGATEGKEPDHIGDGDLKTVEELRGAFKELSKAEMTFREKATVEGVMTEIQVLKQQLEMTHEQMRNLISIYQNLSNEFEVLKQQRIKELTMKVNNGSTTPGD